MEARVPKKPVISIVDDDVSAREGTMDLIRANGYAAEAFEGASEFLNSDRISRTLCLIADVRMPGMTGLELHEHLIEIGQNIPTILMTAYPDARDRQRALRAGVICYLAKPYNQDDLLACIRSTLASRNADCKPC
jgi:FixJ family two-component response regulator